MPSSLPGPDRQPSAPPFSNADRRPGTFSTPGYHSPTPLSSSDHDHWPSTPPSFGHDSWLPMPSPFGDPNHWPSTPPFGPDRWLPTTSPFGDANHWPSTPPPFGEPGRRPLASPFWDPEHRLLTSPSFSEPDCLPPTPPPFGEPAPSNYRHARPSIPPSLRRSPSLIKCYRQPLAGFSFGQHDLGPTSALPPIPKTGSNAPVYNVSSHSASARVATDMPTVSDFFNITFGKL
jgi:hypothetical protein